MVRIVVGIAKRLFEARLCFSELVTGRVLCSAQHAAPLLPLGVGSIS
jgi:hypothetical protein